MISEKLQKAFNDQINKEFFSEYLYLSMQAYFDGEDLEGLAHFFNLQAQEEHQHGMKMYDYLLERGGKVRLEAIQGPKTDFSSPLEVLEETVAHEESVTASINHLMNLAIEEKDHAAKSFLSWFVDEQVEEEASMGKILGKLKLIGKSGHGLLMVDSELSKRTLTET